jgi:hypothetical protein
MTIKELSKHPYFNKKYTKFLPNDRDESTIIVERDYYETAIAIAKDIVDEQHMGFDASDDDSSRDWWSQYRENMPLLFAHYPKLNFEDLSWLLMCNTLVQERACSPYGDGWVHQKVWPISEADLQEIDFKQAF